MARLYGRSPRGERCRAAVPHGHWKTTTFTAGLRYDGLIAPLVLDGPMDGEAFLAYVEQLLAPALRPGGRLYRTHSDDNRVRSPPAVIKASLSECFHGPLSGQVVHDNGASMSRSPLFRSEGMPIPL